MILFLYTYPCCAGEPLGGYFCSMECDLTQTSFLKIGHSGRTREYRWFDRNLFWSWVLSGVPLVTGASGASVPGVSGACGQFGSHYRLVLGATAVLSSGRCVVQQCNCPVIVCVCVLNWPRCQLIAWSVGRPWCRVQAGDKSYEFCMFRMETLGSPLQQTRVNFQNRLLDV